MKWIIAAAITVGLAVVLARRANAAPIPVLQDDGLSWWDGGEFETVEEPPEQLPSAFEEAMQVFDPSMYQQLPQGGQADRNLRAVLDMIAYAEGTAGADGYRTIFGYQLFESFHDHPRIAVQFTDKAGRRLWTTAAGRYQLMAVSQIPTGGATRVNTWDVLKARLQLPDFSPASQDAAAVELIRERGALPDVMAGRIESAIQKIRTVWASLPGAGYQQSERKLSQLLAAYQSAGGQITG